MASNTVRDRYNQYGAGMVSPARLLVMLYDQLVIDVEQTIDALPKHDWDLVNRRLINAQAIVLELHSALDLEVWDGAAGLSQLYTWFDEQLTLANVRKDDRPLVPVLHMMRELRDTWNAAHTQVLAEQSSAVAPQAAAVAAP